MKKKLSSSFRQNPSRPVGCYFEQVFQLLELLLGGGHPDFGRLQGPLVGVEQRRLLQLLQVESEAEKTFLLKKKKKTKRKEKSCPFFNDSRNAGDDDDVFHGGEPGRPKVSIVLQLLIVLRQARRTLLELSQWILLKMVTIQIRTRSSSKVMALPKKMVGTDVFFDELVSWGD